MPNITFFSYSSSPTGASLVGRIASWLAAIWTSMHSVIALLYVGMLSFKSVPFRECNKAVTINQQSIHVSHSSKFESLFCWVMNFSFLSPVSDLSFTYVFNFSSWFFPYRTATMWNPIADRNV